MKKQTLSFICVAALTVWLFVLSYTSANGLDAQVSSVESVSAEQASTIALQAQTVSDQTAQSTGIALPEMPTLSLACQAAVLIEQSTGTILYEYNPDEPRAVASITKVMTLLLTFEAIESGKISLDDTVPVSEHAFSMGGSQIWLEPGEIFTLEELVKAVCVSSANDAAVAIAEYVGGSEDAFVSMMNTRAAELGMTNTTYQNACGLDEENHLSTARDVAVLSCYILQNYPQVLEYTGIWTDTLRDGETHLTNTNKLLNYYNGITGLKTGTTGDAGVCITASATREGLSLVAVVLGSASSTDRFQSAMTMLDYGFATFEAASVPQCADAPQEQVVKGGAVEQVTVDYSAVPQTLLLTKGSGSTLSAEVQLQEVLEAPLQQGAQIGSMQIYCQESLVAEYPLLAAQTIEKLTVPDAMQQMWLQLCTQ